MREPPIHLVDLPEEAASWVSDTPQSPKLSLDAPSLSLEICKHPLALYESGFAPRWYVPREDIDETAFELVELQTFCPYKGICSYYDIGDHKRAAWSYLNAWPEVGRITNLVSFEPDKIEVYLDGKQLHLEPGQTVMPHGVDRGLDTDEVLRKTPTGSTQ